MSEPNLFDGMNLRVTQLISSSDAKRLPSKRARKRQVEELFVKLNEKNPTDVSINRLAKRRGAAKEKRKRRKEAGGRKRPPKRGRKGRRHQRLEKSKASLTNRDRFTRSCKPED